MSDHQAADPTAHPRSVVISNGFHRYHLSDAAAELEAHGRLGAFVTGAYPNAFYRGLHRWPGLRGSSALRRLLERKVAIEPERVRAQNLVELLYLAATRLRDRVPLLAGWAEWARIGFSRLYGVGAAAKVLAARRRGALVYHYRSGFGGASADAARDAGMILLCDHTIAHPQLLEDLIDLDGRMPDVARGDIEPFWGPVLEDLARADYFMVNSEFVRDTFAHQGVDRERVYVVPQGLDGQFTALAEGCERPAEFGETLSIVFAGTVCRRKGFHHLAEALEALGDIPWRLAVAGAIYDGMEESLAGFFRRDNVVYKGVLSRSELASLFAANEVFVFPSLAEGSARVVFEAMACGACVVTTPNSGSVVEDGVSGRLVPAGDPAALADALRDLHRRRSEARRLGERARSVVRERYRQEDFGRRLLAVYDEVERRAEKAKRR